MGGGPSTLSSDQAKELKGNQTYGLACETAGGAVDLDLQCVAVNGNGTIVDAAYYNNPVAAGGIQHSGDDRARDRDNVPEKLIVNLQKLTPDVKLLFFVLALHSGAPLSSVGEKQMTILERGTKTLYKMPTIEKSLTGSVDIVAAMYKHGSKWMLKAVDSPATQGRHFMDILGPLADEIGKFHSSGSAGASISLKQGGILDLPQRQPSIVLALQWDTPDGKDVDLDVSAVVFDKAGTILEAIFWNNEDSKLGYGITKSKDNRTGAGEGVDESMVVDLDKLTRSSADQVVIVVNVYDEQKANTFCDVTNACCYIRTGADVDQGMKLCNFKLNDRKGTGMIVGKLVRGADDRWGFHAMGKTVDGRTYKESLPGIEEAFKLEAQSLMDKPPRPAGVNKNQLGRCCCSSSSANR